jgi:hypothetical protein
MNRAVGRYIVLIAVVSQCLSLGTQAAEPSVVLGRVLYVEKRPRDEFEIARSQYGHANTQFLVVELEKAVLGSCDLGRVILGVKINSHNLEGISWPSASFGLFDPERWKEGSGIVVVFRKGIEAQVGCSPTMVPNIPAGSEPPGDGKGLGMVYQDVGLRSYSDLRVLCVSAESLYLVK